MTLSRREQEQLASEIFFREEATINFVGVATLAGAYWLFHNSSVISVITWSNAYHGLAIVDICGCHYSLYRASQMQMHCVQQNERYWYCM